MNSNGQEGRFHLVQDEGYEKIRWVISLQSLESIRRSVKEIVVRQETMKLYQKRKECTAISTPTNQTQLGWPLE